MNRQEVTQLLGAAAAVDQYAPQPDELVLRIWTSMLADIPMKAADQALMFHYRATSTTITPADIAGYYRDRRRNPPVVERREVDPQLIRDGVDRVMTAWAQAKAISSGADPEDAALVAESNVAARRTWRSVPCPVESCRAAEGAPCTSMGKPLKKSPCHPRRLEAAFNATTISSP
jgi:hypothetical protein